MRIAKNCVVSIEFQLTNATGQLLESAPASKPLEYVHGGAGVLPALERALAGMAPGDGFDITLSPDQAFGERQPSRVEVVPRSRWPNPEQLTVGASVTREDEATGARETFRIRAIDTDTVTVDGNHPLAGETLRFKGKVVAVREATAEERVTQ